MRRLALGGIRFYQRAISPWWPGQCRYSPTCSEFGHVAIERYGIRRGSLLTALRLLRCTPFRAGGYDPVP